MQLTRLRRGILFTATGLSTMATTGVCWTVRFESFKPQLESTDDDGNDLLAMLILILAVCGIFIGIAIFFLLFFVCSSIVKYLRQKVLGLDEDGFSERMRSQLLPDEDSRQSYELGRAFERQYPYGSVNTQLTSEQQDQIREKGVHAWEFVVDLDVNAMLQSKTEVLFMGGENCVQTNLPMPKVNSVYYFEVKVVEKPADVDMWIGLATKPYPAWRMVGWNKYSSGYSINNGSVNQNSPFKTVNVGEQLLVGDILGIGYQPRSGVMWFTRNGRRYKVVVSGMLYDVFPTISANGPCSFSANFGQRGFVFIEANVKRWGFGPVEGTMAPPPIYGANQNTILLEIAAEPSTAPSSSSSSSSSSAGAEENTESAVVDMEGRRRPSSRCRRNSSRSPYRPPTYQKEDPIAAQLLEAGSTTLEPVAHYRNMKPDDDDIGESSASAAGSINE